MFLKPKGRERKRKTENLIEFPGKNKNGEGNRLKRKLEGGSKRKEVILRANQKEITDI